MKRLTKLEMANETVKLLEISPYEKETFQGLMKLTWDELDTKLAALKIFNHKNSFPGCQHCLAYGDCSERKTTKQECNFYQPQNEEKKMSKFEMKENFVIGAKDAKLLSGVQKPAKDAIAAVEGVKAVKAVKAIPAVKANKKEGIKASKAVPAVEGVKAVKAIPAKEAVPACYTMKIYVVSEEAAQEILARMADQDVIDDLDGQILAYKEGFSIQFKAETDKPIRAAFKASKAKDGYNTAGLKLLADKKKADAKAKADSEKAKEKAKDKIKESDAPKETPEDEKGEWPGSFDDKEKE